MKHCIKVVSTAGSLTFGVYLLHDNDLLREKLWGIIDAPRFLNNLGLELLYMIGIVLLIFTVGCAAEYVRKKIVGAIKVETIIGGFVDSVYERVTNKIRGNKFLE